MRCRQISVLLFLLSATGTSGPVLPDVRIQSDWQPVGRLLGVRDELGTTKQIGLALLRDWSAWRPERRKLPQCFEETGQFGATPRLIEGVLFADTEDHINEASSGRFRAAIRRVYGVRRPPHCHLYRLQTSPVRPNGEEFAAGQQTEWFADPSNLLAYCLSSELGSWAHRPFW